jgi:hypothetical protein
MHDLRQRRCPTGTPTRCKKRVATAWLTHEAAAGRSSPLGPQAHLPLINVGPHGVGQSAESSVGGRFQSKPFLQCACWHKADVTAPLVNVRCWGEQQTDLLLEVYFNRN